MVAQLVLVELKKITKDFIHSKKNLTILAKNIATIVKIPFDG